MESVTLAPRQEDVDGFNSYAREYARLLQVERLAVEAL